MPNGDYFIIGIYGLFPTICASVRPVVHFLFSAEAFEDKHHVLPLRVYGLSLEINVVAFTDCYLRYSLHSPFTTLGTH